MSDTSNIEIAILQYIAKHNGKLTDYQACRHLIQKYDPDVVQNCLQEIREKGLADLIKNGDTPRWFLLGKGILKLNLTQ